MIFLGLTTTRNVLLNNESRFYTQPVHKSLVVRYNFSITMNFGNIFLKFRISTSFIIHTFRNHIKIKIKYCNNLNPFFTKAMSVNELGGRKKMRQFPFFNRVLRDVCYYIIAAFLSSMLTS